MTDATSPPEEKAEALKALCDEIQHRAAKLMVENGAPMEMMLDRVLTFAAAQSCNIAGSPRTAAVFREVADKIDAGLFHRVTGENVPRRDRH